MSRAIVLLLQVGLMLSAIAGILFAVRIILQQTIGGSWYWGGAIAAFVGPVAFALALLLVERSGTFPGVREEGPK
jgi:hypothetical protein